MLVLDEISDAPGPRRVRTLPGVECCLALWTARAPEHEPLKASARKLEASFSQGLRRRTARLDAALFGWPLGALNWFYARRGEVSETLDRLTEEPYHRLALELMLGSMRQWPLPDGAGDDPELALESMAMVLGARSQEARRRVRSLLRNPDTIVDAILDVLATVWERHFESIWARQRPHLDRIACELDDRLAEDFVGALAGTSARAVYEPDRDRLLFVGGQSTRVVRTPAVGLLEIVPSLWLRRRVVLAHGAGGVGLCMGPVGQERDRPPLTDLPAHLEVLGDPRRFAILRMCMSEPHSNLELSRRLCLTPGPVSRHLKQLALHGFVVGQRFGRVVTYTAVPEAVALIGNELARLPERALADGG